MPKVDADEGVGFKYRFVICLIFSVVWCGNCSFKDVELLSVLNGLIRANKNCFCLALPKQNFFFNYGEGNCAEWNYFEKV